jgi:hypothetical protein
MPLKKEVVMKTPEDVVNIMTSDKFSIERYREAKLLINSEGWSPECIMNINNQIESIHRNRAENIINNQIEEIRLKSSKKSLKLRKIFRHINKILGIRYAT